MTTTAQSNLGEVQDEAADTAIDPVLFPRRHPLIFTRSEAAAYLGLKSTRSLRTVEKEFGLQGHRPAGKEKLYHREELDDAAKKMFGKDLRQSGGKP